MNTKMMLFVCIALLLLGMVYANNGQGPLALDNRSAAPQRNIGPAKALVVYDQDDPSRIIGYQTFAGEGVNLTPALADHYKNEILTAFANSGSEALSFDGRPFFDHDTVNDLRAMDTSQEAISGGKWTTVRQSCEPGCPKFDWRCCILVGCSGPAKNCYLLPGPTPIV